MHLVTLRPADLRFLLPTPPATAVSDDVLIANALEEAGIAIDYSSDADVDVAFCTRRMNIDASIERAHAVIMNGRPAVHARRALHEAGFFVRTLLVRMGPDGPRLAVPVDGPPLPWALLRWGRPPNEIRAARNAGVVAAAKLGLPVSTVTIATRDRALPYPIAAAAPLGVTPATWCFSPGAGDELQRAAFHCFPEGAREPSWIVKLSRRPGNDRPFEADARGLKLVADAGLAVTAHAPALLGRFAADGLPASAETSARGRPLVDWLLARGATNRKHELIAAVASWLTDVTVATATASDDLDAERARLAALPDTADALGRVADVPGVLAHMDPGTWNIVSDGRAFTLLDWEAARRPAFPLWDLMYFLVDAFAMLDGSRGSDEALARVLALCRGEHRDSPRFFALVRAYVHRTGLPTEAVGPLALLGWIHHSRSHLTRNAALDAIGGPGANAPAELSHLARLAEPWRADPALGTNWSRWLG
jgi:hypothetical protein